MLTPSTEEVCAAEKSVTVDREVRAAGEIGSGELMERPRLRRPRQDSIRPPRWCLSKNSPGPRRIILLPRRPAAPISHEETTTVLSPVAEAEEHEIEEQVTHAASAEPAVTPFATAPVDTAAEALAAPSAPEPPRPRRSGWWQRARASVIGK